MNALRLALIAAVALSACARKGDPLPPDGATEKDEPRLVAPSVVTDPIRRPKL